ncbi:type I-E CRISPR-associated protein Cas7/Cse4/CasC [Actinomyces wuliandei]|uniref:type I-E CRISPR-associated protein Cas7/Cse4/CasC n=1 Tax=Actinomyces wuliandei TaxID=2057743 RepID=UPI000FD6ECF1|nr:type I-E CRISPR-associated protein Cas7/Cse4/CasC [Actinomyces wuliandei]
MSTYVDIHVIQNLPPSCVNRDDTGSPKSAVYGGVRRLRVSSQSWKRATRLYFRDHLKIEGLGMRTRRLHQVLSDKIAAIDPSLAEESTRLAVETVNLAGNKDGKIVATNRKGEVSESNTPLFFISPSQIEEVARLAVGKKRGDKVKKGDVEEALDALAAIDIALFGRMVAAAPRLRMDAACQVAHAISTHAAETEYDFFTAVDDAKHDSDEEGDAGAGMMSTVEFSSATVYRYATVNIDMLKENLGEIEATLRALTAFIEGFVRSMPSGKQNTFANRTLPEAVVVTVRDDQPVSLVGAFEKQVRQTEDSGYLQRSVEALARHATTIEANYGAKPLHSYVVSLSDSEAVASLGERVAFTELGQRVRDSVAPRVPGQEQA